MIAAATIHAPYLTGWPERADAAHRAATMDGFTRLGQAFRDDGVDTLVVMTSEHIVNLQPRLVAPFIIGAGDMHRPFPEPHFKLSSDPIRGDAALARELVTGFYRHGIDLAHSSDLVLDHGTTLPLKLMGVYSDMAVVPIVVNSIFAPMPSLERCRILGRVLAELLGRLPPGRRVGLLATGGVSHTVGAPGVDANDPEFDRRFIDALVRGDLGAVTGLGDADLDRAGNGTHEIRNWVTVAAAMQPDRPEVVTAIPFAPGWNTGVHQLLWRGR